MNFYRANRRIKIYGLAFLLLFVGLLTANAVYAEETLITGNGKGVFCGTDGEDYLYACIKTGSQNVSYQTVANSGSHSTPPQPTKAAPGGSHNASRAGLASMPKLDGVNYQQTTETDGKVRIIASGDTFKKKKLLAQSGFQWDEQQKIWWRYAA